MEFSFINHQQNACSLFFDVVALFQSLTVSFNLLHNEKHLVCSYTAMKRDEQIRRLLLRNKTGVKKRGCCCYFIFWWKIWSRTTFSWYPWHSFWLFFVSNFSLYCLAFLLSRRSMFLISFASTLVYAGYFIDRLDKQHWLARTARKIFHSLL